MDGKSTKFVGVNFVVYIVSFFDYNNYMIDRVFWDIDETLIHTEMRPFEEGWNDVEFKLDGDSYYTKIRPCSTDLVTFSRNLVGAENVYILTTSTRDYAREINRIAGWDFAHDHIFSREDLHEHRYTTAYGGYTTMENKSISSPNNVIIDNLPTRENWNKMAFIGIDSERYFKVPDYWGADFPDDKFLIEDIKEFLTKLHSNGEDDA
jgi:hypothetical protein